MRKTKIHLTALVTLAAMVLSLANPFAITAFAYLSDDVTELPSPIDNGKTEIFTDDCANFDLVYGGTLEHFQKNSGDPHRAWNDSERISPKSVPKESGVPDDRYLIYAAPGEKDITSFAFWMYFYGSGRMDMDIYISADGISYDKVECEQLDPERYEYESGKYSFYHRLFSLDNLDKGIKYIKLAWKNWGQSQATEGHLGKVQLGYVNESTLPIEIYGEANNDILRNKEKLFSFSGIESDYSDPEIFNYDSARIIKTQEVANVVYKALDGYDLTDFAAWTYYESARNEDFVFSVSPDGEIYTAFIPEVKENPSNGWLENVYYMENIPVGSKYLKIEFPETDNAQLGQVVVGNIRYKLKVTENRIADKIAAAKVSNRSFEDKEVSLVIAQYNSDNEMLCANIDTQILSSGETKTLTADISAEAQPDGEIKSFVCSGLKLMTPSETDGFVSKGTLALNKVDVDGYRISVSGILSADETDEKVNLLVLKDDTDVNNIVLSDIVYIGQTADVNDDGSFKYSFNMPQSSESKYYVALVSGTDVAQTQTAKFLFVNKNERDEVTTLINNVSSSDEVKAIFDGTSDDGDFRLALEGMNIQLEAYTNMTEEEKSSVALMIFEESKLGAYTSEHLAKFSNKAIATVSINSSESNSDIARAMSEGNAVFGFDDENTKFGAAYKAMNEEQKTALCAYVLKAIPVLSPSDLQETVNDAVIAAYFNTATYDEIEELLTEYKDDIGIDSDLWKKYSSMSRYNKSVVDKAMVGNDFTAIEEIESTFEDAIDDVSNSYASSGGGGSTRASSGSTAKSTALYEFENTSEDSKEEIIFTDLTGFDWATDSIEYLTEKKIISGYGDGTFKPSHNVKREEFVKMLTAAFGIVADSNKCSFSDVSENDWSYKYIASAYGLGIVNGYTDGRFGTGENITREDMAVMAYNILLKQGIELSSSSQMFTDSNDISDYALEAVNKLCASGVINGVGDNRFAPSEFTTRAQAAKVIYGLLQLK